METLKRILLPVRFCEFIETVKLTGYLWALINESPPESVKGL